MLYDFKAYIRPKVSSREAELVEGAEQSVGSSIALPPKPLTPKETRRRYIPLVLGASGLAAGTALGFRVGGSVNDAFLSSMGAGEGVLQATIKGTLHRKALDKAPNLLNAGIIGGLTGAGLGASGLMLGNYLTTDPKNNPYEQDSVEILGGPEETASHT